MNIINVENLVKKYDKFTAVNGVDFQVKQGEIFGLLGPNGAGKTTTVEILEGLRKATSGIASIDGIDVSKNSNGVKKIIGVQLQECSFFDKLTLYEIIEMFSVLYSTTADIDSILEKVGLIEKKKSYYKPLSGGQKQRLSIARAILKKSPIILLDEATSSLDAESENVVQNAIKNLTKNKTTLVIAHRLSTIHNADIIFVIKNGKLIDSGKHDELINSCDYYKSLYEKQLK